MIILHAVKNFFKNLKYYFTPLGALFLGVIIALAAIVPVLLASLNSFAASVREIVAGAGIDVEVFAELFLDRFSELPSDVSDAVNYILTTDWLAETLNELMNTLSSEAGAYVSGLELAAAELIGSAVGCLAVLFSFCVLGLLAGFWITKKLIRKEIARRSLWKYILVTAADSILLALITYISARIFRVWTPGGFIAVAISALVFGFVNLLEAYLVQACGKVRFRKAVSIKNICFLFIGFLAVFSIAALFSALAVSLFGNVVGVAVAFPVIEIAIIVNGLNAESYMKKLAETQSLPPDARVPSAENEKDA